MLREPIRKAGRILSHGGVVAYPTEGVFGLGARPESLEGAARILNIKQRDPDAGMILIAAHAEQLSEWIAADVDVSRLTSSAERPVTWIVPPSTSVPYWITGANDGVAVRITTHPTAAALCEATDSALISTSANVAGRSPARNALLLRRQFRDSVDYVVPGRCGPAAGPSEIRVLDSDQIIRGSGG